MRKRLALPEGCVPRWLPFTVAGLVGVLLLGVEVPMHPVLAMHFSASTMVSCSANPCATRVYGQPDFVTNTPNRVTAGSLNQPEAATLDAGGNLYLADSINNRVLYFPVGSTTATRVYGQLDFSSYGANTGGISASTLSRPQGVAVDPSGGIYVADTYNFRVLHYPANCNTNGCPADRVYGPVDYTHSRPSSLPYPNSVAADGSGMYVAQQGANRVLHFPGTSTTPDLAYGQPNTTSTTANNGGISPTSLYNPEGVVIDGSGGLYIADAGNNRILHYPASCNAGNCMADAVYGQPSFTVNGANNGGVSAASLNVDTGNTVGMAPDGSGGLYVSDTQNNRILHYAIGSTTADLVYGQPNFTSTAAGISATAMASPYGLAVDGSGTLYAVDAGNNRVLYFTAGSTTATRVLGQPDFTSSSPGQVSAGTLRAGFAASHVGAVLDGSGGLYLADNGNNRVLHYPIGSTTPDRVYGQPNVTASSANNGGVTASSLNGPAGLAVDSSGGLYIADSGNNRVLYYPSGSTTATQVYGQSDFASNGYTLSASATSLRQPEGLAVDSTGLYVTDAQNSRVLHYPTGSTAADRAYGQPSLTANGTSCGSPTAATLCLPQGLAADGSGGLYVADSSNNRVLYYPAGSTTPSRVYGQPNFTSGTSAGHSATGLNLPVAIAVDGNGSVYIADALNYRVLYYPAGSTTATRVYGQADTGSYYYSYPPSAGTFYQGPSGLAVDGSGGIYAIDGGNNRALFFPGPTVLYPRLDVAAPVANSIGQFSSYDVFSNAPVRGTDHNAAALSTSPGSSQTNTLVRGVGSGDYCCTGFLAEFDSAPLAAQTIPAGTWTIGTAMIAALAAGSGTPAYFPLAQITLVNGATGQARTVISAQTFLGAFHTGTGEQTALGMRTTGSITVQAGDYLALELGIENYEGPTFDATLDTSGATPITIDGQSTTNARTFLQAPGPLTFQ